MNAVYIYMYGSGPEDNNSEPAGGGGNGTEAQSKETPHVEDGQHCRYGQGYNAAY